MKRKRYSWPRWAVALPDEDRPSPSTVDRAGVGHVLAQVVHDPDLDRLESIPSVGTRMGVVNWEASVEIASLPMLDEDTDEFVVAIRYSDGSMDLEPLNNLTPLTEQQKYYAIYEGRDEDDVRDRYLLPEDVVLMLVEEE